MFDFDTQERKTNIRPQLSASMTEDEFVRAILTPEGYTEAIALRDENPAYPDYTHLSQTALREYAIAMRFSAHELAYGPFDAESIEHLFEVAKIAFGFIRFVHTDTPCMMWASPWDYRCDTPADFVAYMVAFSLETDERTVNFDSEEAPEEKDVRLLLDFLMKNDPNATYEWVVESLFGLDIEENYVPEYVRSYFPGCPESVPKGFKPEWLVHLEEENKKFAHRSTGD